MEAETKLKNPVDILDAYRTSAGIGYMVTSNLHIPIMQTIHDLAIKQYKIQAKFEYQGFNGHRIWCNGKQLVHRPSKFKDIVFHKNVIQVIEHNFSHKSGGSHSWPAVGQFKGAYCILEFISNGLPFIDKTNGWLMTIQTIEEIG